MKQKCRSKIVKTRATVSITLISIKRLNSPVKDSNSQFG